MELEQERRAAVSEPKTRDYSTVLRTGSASSLTTPAPPRGPRQRVEGSTVIAVPARVRLPYLPLGR